MPGGRKKHTPLCSLVPILPRTLYQVVTKNICDLDGVVYLHPRVDTRAPVLVEVVTGFLACGVEDSCVVWMEVVNVVLRTGGMSAAYLGKRCGLREGEGGRR